MLGMLLTRLFAVANTRIVVQVFVGACCVEFTSQTFETVTDRVELVSKADNTASCVTAVVHLRLDSSSACTHHLAWLMQAKLVLHLICVRVAWHCEAQRVRALRIDNFLVGVLRGS